MFIVSTTKSIVKISFVSEPKLQMKDFIRKPVETIQIIDFQEPEDDLFNKSDEVENCPICERMPCLSCSVYGASACNNCRIFFFRTVRRVREHLRLERCQSSSSSNSCDLKKDRPCMPCRYEKCLSVGMLEEQVKTEEEKKKKYFFKGASEKVTKGPKEARSWNRPEKTPGKEIKKKETSGKKKKMVKKKNQHLRKNAKNTTKENLKERNIAKAKLANQSKSNKKSSRMLDMSVTETNSSKTVTKRKKRGDSLKMSGKARKLDLNSNNSDDMFKHRKAPSPVSQKILEDSSSDDESDPDGVSKTPVVDYLKNFGGWSKKTPKSVRDITRSDNRQNKSQAAKGKKNKMLKKATAAKSKPGNLNSNPSKRKPALSETDGQPNSEMDDDN